MHESSQNLLYCLPSASQPPAPSSFDVIDTSNLTDHLGLLNILFVAQPLLKAIPASQAVLYTEMLLPTGEDATKSFLDRVCASVPTISALLGIAPRAYVSAFAAHSNSHELLSPTKANQYHERVTWADPSGGDQYASPQKIAVSFDAEDLAHIIFGFYHKMFANEQVMATMVTGLSLTKRRSMEDICYHRETMVALLQLIKRWVQLKTGSWDIVADELLRMVEGDRSQIIGAANYQDLCMQLHLYGVHTVATLQPDWRVQCRTKNPSRIFKSWPKLPPMLCVVLSVPHKSLQVLLRDKAAGMPTLQCNFTAQGTYSAYSTIHTAWGRCISSQNSDTVILEEDPQGINGTSDLVVSVWALSCILELADMFVALAIKNTPGSTISFISKLGMQLKLFSARLDDKEHVQLLPYRPSLASEEPLMIPTAVTWFADPTSDSSSISIAVGASPGNGPPNIASFTAHVDVGSPAERGVLLSRAEVLVMQIAPCTMKISFSSYHHTISYPYPTRGSQHRLRIARKSHYVEVIVPVSEPLDLGGYHLNRTPILQTNAYSPWNIHHIHVDRIPLLNLKVPKKIDWLDSHTALQLSDRERGIRNGDSVTKSAPANVLVNVKNSIQALMMISSGVQGK
ncbi:hypothetical protein FRC06_006946, partial [Ceratobasidium sp. 370]